MMEEEPKEIRITVEKQIQEKIDYIKEFHCLKTTSELFRYLIAKEHRKAMKKTNELTR